MAEMPVITLSDNRDKEINHCFINDTFNNAYVEPIWVFILVVLNTVASAIETHCELNSSLK